MNIQYTIFTLFLVFSLPSCGVKKEKAKPLTMKFAQLVLDSERTPLANPSVWISRTDCYSAFIHPDTNAPRTEGTRWIESRYQFRITENSIRDLEEKVSALLAEGRRRFRDPVPGERIDSLFVVTGRSRTVCIEKPNDEPWMAFDQVKELLLQLHSKFANEDWLLYEAEADYPSMWSPPGFQTQDERSAIQIEESKISKNFLGEEK